MRVSITQEVKKGGLLGGKTEWHTKMKITPTEEELSIVSAGNLGKFDVLALPTISGTDDLEYSVDEVMTREMLATSPNKWHANEMAKRMKAGAMSLKSLLEESMADETGDFEL